eukprot:TRINITY_DN1056_c0_g1_i5.p1 TRINITY_DN1056_c0_g1~~TRINITY_DN1056_c0_g1_i5.p1  ORF type:complete len:441 (+),score=87.85 TRINITY_DN1056_c0_g1_i5:547-1869(+)
MHPDKGGDKDKFAELQEAYEILHNPEKRDIYDKYGLEAARTGQAPMGGFGDIFGSFFGGGGGRGQARGPKKAKPMLKEIEVPLEDVYTGKLLKIPIERYRTCESCDGKGGANVKTCTKCKGHGMVEKVIQFGPGMYQQSTGPCSDCKGQGKMIEEKDKCKTCKGERVVKQKKVVEVAVEAGVPDEHDYVYSGESDEYPGVMAGDLVVRVKVKQHRNFIRKGADLFYKKEITLLEALTGFHFDIEHLDKKILTVSTYPGDVISDGLIKTIKRKGLPFYRDAMSHGNLYVQFSVKFPKRSELKKEQLDALKQILPGPKTGPHPVKEGILFMEDFEPEEVNSNAAGGKGREQDDDEDMPRGGQRVQCATQQWPNFVLYIYIIQNQLVSSVTTWRSFLQSTSSIFVVDTKSHSSSTLLQNDSLLFQCCLKRSSQRCEEHNALHN